MSRWRTGRSSRTSEPARVAHDGAVAAFLDLDTRQRFVAEAIDALAAVDEATAAGAIRRPELAARWDVIEQQCFTASSHYLAVSQRYPHEHQQVGPQVAAEFHQVHVELAEAASAVDRFYSGNRAALDQARAAVAATPNIARTARERAAQSLEKALTHPRVSAYRSVLRAQTALDQACDLLDRAGTVAATRSAANQVFAAATALDEAVATAEKADAVAATTLTSVRTRIDALAVRAERLGETRSALLREFNAASTRDLVGLPEEARRHLAEAGQDWEEAGRHLRAGDAESALDRLHAAREHLNEGDAAVKAVTDRLHDLREVRRDPEAPLRQARFTVRDAQRLVMDRDLVAEWGSVLDAQSARLDRVAAGLAGVHPDYWAYLGELRAVAEFVAGVVDRVRTQVAGR